MPTRVRPEARLRPSSEIPRDTAESLARHILYSPTLASSMAWSGNFNMLARRNAGTTGKTTAHLVAMARAGARGFRERALFDLAIKRGLERITDTETIASGAVEKLVTSVKSRYGIKFPFGPGKAKGENGENFRYKDGLERLKELDLRSVGGKKELAGIIREDLTALKVILRLEDDEKVSVIGQIERTLNHDYGALRRADPGISTASTN